MTRHLITNIHRGVYIGEIIGERDGAVTARNLRHVSFWTCSVPGGISSLAVVGPGPGTLAGAPAPEGMIRHVGNTYLMTPAAEAAWDALDPGGKTIGGPIVHEGSGCGAADGRMYEDDPSSGYGHGVADGEGSDGYRLGEGDGDADGGGFTDNSDGTVEGHGIGGADGFGSGHGFGSGTRLLASPHWGPDSLT